MLGKNGVTVHGTLHTPGSPPVVLHSQDNIQIADRSFYFLLPSQPQWCTPGLRTSPPAWTPVARCVVHMPACMGSWADKRAPCMMVTTVRRPGLDPAAASPTAAAHEHAVPQAAHAQSHMALSQLQQQHLHLYQQQQQQQHVHQQQQPLQGQGQASHAAQVPQDASQRSTSRIVASLQPAQQQAVVRVHQHCVFLE